MSVTTVDAEHPPDEARRGHSLRSRWARARWPLAVAAAVLATAVVGVVLLRPSGGALLDPDSAAPSGARALVNVLSDHGVEVTRRTAAEDVLGDARGAAGAVTVMVARTDLLTPGPTELLGQVLTQTSAEVVLVEPSPRLLADLDLPVSAAPTADPKALQPRCDLAVASRAGAVVSGSTAYRSASATASCYPTDDGATYLVLDTPGGGRVVLLGSAETLTNASLGDEGDGALAIGTLGRTPQLVWWTPTPQASAGEGEKSLTELLPPQVGWVAVQLLVVLLVVMLWRGRRLGRLVTEPLPVVVRSVETTLGRAALYRRARARGRAAQVLRAAAGRRIAVRCALPRTAPPGVVASVAAERTGRPVAAVAALLSGPAPADDGELVALARDLDSLESALRREVAHL